MYINQNFPLDIRINHGTILIEVHMLTVYICTNIEWVIFDKLIMVIKKKPSLITEL